MKKFLTIIGILALTISTIALPVDTKAKTIKEFEDEVAKYTKELQDKQNKIAKNDAEVAEIKKKITSIESQINQAEEDIKRLQEEIDASNKEIAKKTEESKKIIEYYQISNGNNAYLEYAFGASDITDMIYRMSIVEQLTEYNEKIMTELEALIKKNEQAQKDLKAKQEELGALKTELQEQKARIDADSTAIRETMPSVENQIKEAKSNVEYFKKLGCGPTEDILTCQFRISQNSSNSVPSVGEFSRPIENGYSVRGFSGKNGHMGYDMSSSNRNIAVHPIAAGVIHAIYTDDCTGGRWCQNMGFSCHGNARIVVVKHNYNNRYIYSAYVHLSSYGNISTGMYVTRDTIIGYMGTTGCSTGEHLHLEMASCHWKNNGGCSYAGYTNSLINPSTLINFPSRWNNR